MEPTRIPLRARRAAALAAVAAVAALAIPSAAGAALTPTIVDATHVTLNGDATADTIVLSDGTGADPQLNHNLPVNVNGIDSTTDFDPTPG
jgi:hypothetical protein